MKGQDLKMSVGTKVHQYLMENLLDWNCCHWSLEGGWNYCCCYNYACSGKRTFDPASELGLKGIFSPSFPHVPFLPSFELLPGTIVPVQDGPIPS